MLKLVFPLITILVLGVGGFYFYQSSKPKIPSQKTSSENLSGAPSASPITSPQVTVGPCEALTKGSADVPPLYKNDVTWQQPKTAQHDVPLAEGSSQMNGCLIKSSEIEFSSASKARSFYASEVLNKGWNNISSSDLPGEAGSDTWSKNSRYLLFEILPLKKPNVQVTLFYTQ